MGLGVSIIYCLLRCLFVVLHRLFCMKVGFKPLKGILLSAIMGLFYVTIRVIGIPTPLSESQIPRIPQKKILSLTPSHPHSLLHPPSSPSPSTTPASNPASAPSTALPGLLITRSPCRQSGGLGRWRFARHVKGR